MTSTSTAAGIAAVGTAAAVALVLLYRVRRRKKPSAEEVEAQRRAWLSQLGKLAGGEIIEIHPDAISYLYEVRGLTYTASQDIVAIREKLPLDFELAIGGIGVKYDPYNPANSIILSESWTGLPNRNRALK